MIAAVWRLAFTVCASSTGGCVVFHVAAHHIRRCAACRSRHLTH